MPDTLDNTLGLSTPEKFIRMSSLTIHTTHKLSSLTTDTLIQLLTTDNLGTGGIIQLFFAL